MKHLFSGIAIILYGMILVIPGGVNGFIIGLPIASLGLGFAIKGAYEKKDK